MNNTGQSLSRSIKSDERRVKSSDLYWTLHDFIFPALIARDRTWHDQIDSFIHDGSLFVQGNTSVMFVVIALGTACISYTANFEQANAGN